MRWFRAASSIGSHLWVFNLKKKTGLVSAHLSSQHPAAQAEEAGPAWPALSLSKTLSQNLKNT